MLKRRYRLGAGTRLKNATSVKTPFFTIFISSNSLPESRFGFIVSKKVDKKATVRNSVKRKVRAGIESQLEQIKSGHDMLFVVRKNVLSQSTEDIKKAVTEALTKNSVLK